MGTTTLLRQFKRPLSMPALSSRSVLLFVAVCYLLLFQCCFPGELACNAYTNTNTLLGLFKEFVVQREASKQLKRLPIAL